MKILSASILGLFVMAGCYSNDSSKLNDAEAINAQVSQEGSSEYRRFLVEAGESLKACAVYPHITIHNNTATLKNVRHIEPNVRCEMAAFDENSRSYNIALESEKGCSKVYKGKNEEGSILINDYRGSLCEVKHPGEIQVQELHNGSTLSLWSVDHVIDNSKPKPFKAFIVSASEALSQEALKPCAVYKSISFTPESITISNLRYIDPRAFCPSVYILPEARTYKLKLVEKSFCGDTYEGTEGVHSVKVVDYRAALCEPVIPGVLEVEETYNGEHSILWSKSNLR